MYPNVYKHMENQAYSAEIIAANDGSYVAYIYHSKELIKEHKTNDVIEASIWLDDEMSRLNTNKGVWDE